MAKYIYQYTDWPQFRWDTEVLFPLLAEVRYLQGKLLGAMQTLGFDLQNEANLENLTLDVLKSSEIEGEIFAPEQVRSSLARRLGLNISGLVPSDRDVDGVVDMLLDATQNQEQALSATRLFDWHAALFPTGRSGMYKIIVADWRDDSTGPMQVVSGAMGYEKVHFQAPAAEQVAQEMEAFLGWFNTNDVNDPLIKAGIAHLWFITIHPFEDGNGRIARALTDLLLARADGTAHRFYSMSSQIRVERQAYYKILEDTQQDDLDITEWLDWFLNCLLRALQAADVILQKVLTKHRFWLKHARASLNERQVFMLNRLLDDFYGKLTTAKWAKMNKVSTDTALRDISDLLKKNILEKEDSGGRSTKYRMVNL